VITETEDAPEEPQDDDDVVEGEVIQ